MTTEAQDKGEMNLETMTTEQFVEAVGSNMALRTDYLHNPEKYKRFDDELNGVASSSSGNAAGDSANDATNTPSPAADPDELVVTVKVKKDQLGSFLKNRTPEEAVLAKLKGKDEADRYIETLKDNIGHISKETGALRKQLQETQSKIPTEPAQSTAPAGALPDIEKLRSADLFEVDGQKTLIDSVSQLTEEVTSLRSKSAANQPVVSQKPSSDDLVARQTEFNRNEALLMKELQYQVPELATTRDILDVDRDVALAYNAIDRIAGAQSPNAGVNLFMSNSPQGIELRERCKVAGVALPEEYDQWYQIMSLREKRIETLETMADTLSKKRGETFSIYDLADTPNLGYTDLYNTEKSKIGSPIAKLQGALADHQSARTAAALPAGTVPEVPQSIMQTQYPADVMAWTDDMAENFVKSKPLDSFTRDEAVLYKNLCVALKEPVPEKILNKLK